MTTPLADVGVALHTLDAAMAAPWRAAFATQPVDIIVGDILHGSADALVSPANSFGIMTGGLDGHYTRCFGDGLQRRLQARIRAEHDGELAVGSALVIAIGHDRFRWLVSAPTMRTPSRIAASDHVFLAFRAALSAVIDHNLGDSDPIRSLRVPALGAGVGGMPFDEVARQMRRAWDAIAGQR